MSLEFFKSKKSVLLMILIGFWGGYTFLSLFFTIKHTVDYQEKANISQMKSADYVMENAQNYILQENIDLANETLGHAIDLKYINYFCLKNKNKILYENYVNDKSLSACQILDHHEIENFNTFYRVNDRYLKFSKFDDYLLIIGFSTDLVTFIIQSQKDNLSLFLKDIFMITLFVGCLAYLVLKDILSLDRLIQKGGLKEIGQLKGLSKEAETLIQSTLTMSQMNNQSLSHISDLQNTTGKALATEIENRTPHLSSVQCCVVRLDLNGYTQIFLEKKEAHMVSVLNEYFHVANDIINRYGGEIYQIIGDEIIFLIKKSNLQSISSNGEATIEANREENRGAGHKKNLLLDIKQSALFCVRAIFEWASLLDQKINSEFSHRFLLKASISVGNLKFVNLNTGYSFTGVPLIESVRLLGCVSDKTENTLIVTKVDFNEVLDFIDKPEERFASLKGFDDAFSIFEIKNFISFSDYYNRYFQHLSFAEQRKKSENLKLFKSHLDILFSLEMINRLFHKEKTEHIFYFLQGLRTTQILIEQPKISKKLFQILSDHFVSIQQNSEKFPFLNGLILLVPQFVTMSLWSEIWTGLVKNYLFSKNPRLVANATEVYFSYHSEMDDIKNIFLQWKNNNRISANVLLPQFKRDINKKQVEEIISWLKSEDPLFQSSAIYLIEKILVYYFKNDPVVYRTNSYIGELKTEALNLQDSTSTMVKQRVSQLVHIITELESKSKPAFNNNAVIELKRNHEYALTDSDGDAEVHGIGGVIDPDLPMVSDKSTTNNKKKAS